MAKHIIATFLALLVAFAVAANVAELLEQSEALVKKGQVEEALELLEDALDAQKLAAADPLLVGHVARFLYEAQDYDGTVKFVKDALAAGVKHPLLNYYRARVAFDHRSELNVEEDLNAVLAALPEHIGATILKGMYLRNAISDDEEAEVMGEEAEKRAEAKAESERLLKLGLSYPPVTADDYEQQASAYMYLQDLENSSRLVEAAIALNPGRPPLHLIRCLVRVSQEDIDGGLGDCRQALKLSKKGPIKEAIEAVLELIQYAQAAQEAEGHMDGGDDDGHGHAHEHHEGCGHGHDDL